jgi:hypothetical protein
MNHPKVYDAKGRVLELGSRVRGRLGDAEVTGYSTFTPNASGMTVFVLIDGDSEETPYHARPQLSPDIFWTPDLLLITNEEKGDGDATQ